MRATDGLSSRFGKPKVFHLTFLNEFLHDPGHVFDRYVWINAMLIEQINGIDFEPLERGIGHLFDMVRPAIQTRRSLHASRIELGIKIKTEFRRYHDLSTKGGERFAYKLLIRERPVHFSGVEEGDAALDGCAYESDHFLLVGGRAIGKSHSPANKTESGNCEVAVSEFAVLHFSSESCLNTNGGVLHAR